LVSTAHERFQQIGATQKVGNGPGVLKQASRAHHEGRIFGLEPLIGSINFSIAKLFIFAQFSFGFQTTNVPGRTGGHHPG